MMDEENDNNSIPSIKLYSINKSSDNINNPIIEQLIEFGFNPLYSKRIFIYYHPQNVEDALDYLSFEDGIIQHHFVQDRSDPENNICYLCGEEANVHLKSAQINNNSFNIINSFNNNINNNSINNINNNIAHSINNNSNNNNINNFNLNPFHHSPNLHQSFLDINDTFDLLKKKKINIKSQSSIECPTCDELFHPNDINKLKNCGHSFCNDCWYNFLSIKIKENKISSIKCLDYECQEKPDDNFIFNLLNNDEALIEKYKKFKFELDILNDPNKKLCPFPNCDSYLEMKDEKNKYVKCLNNHEFCFLCLDKPHGELLCNKTMNNALKEYSKNNLIKKCPKCGIITEKYEGCNHITCSKCSYQWCWLCNGKYSEEHFNQGKCKGFQFFRPKDEEDIKLAFEGKIELRESQRQSDVGSFELSERNSFLEQSFGNPVLNGSNINIENNNRIPMNSFVIESVNMDDSQNNSNLTVNLRNNNIINNENNQINPYNPYMPNINQNNENYNQNMSLNINQNSNPYIIRISIQSINKNIEEDIDQDSVEVNNQNKNIYSNNNINPIIKENNIENINPFVKENSIENINPNVKENNNENINQNNNPINNQENDGVIQKNIIFINDKNININLEDNIKDNQEDDKSKEENNTIHNENKVENNNESNTIEIKDKNENENEMRKVEGNNENNIIGIKNNENNNSINNTEKSNIHINILNNKEIKLDNIFQNIEGEEKNENIDNKINDNNLSENKEIHNSISLKINEPSKNINEIDISGIQKIKNISYVNDNIGINNNINHNNIDIKNNINDKKDNNNISNSNENNKKIDNIKCSIDDTNINNSKNLENKNQNNNIHKSNKKIILDKGESMDSQDNFISKRNIHKPKKKFEKKNNETEVYNFDFPQKLLIIFIYIFFGHIFIPTNIFLKIKNSKCSLITFLIYEIPYFFIQFLFNIFMIFIYVFKFNLNSFIFEFYNNIKINYKNKYIIHDTTIYTYYIFLILFSGTYLGVFFILKKIVKANNNISYIIGFIFSFLIIPLHIIINPIILILITINSNFNSKKILIKIKELVNCLKDNNCQNNNK